MAYIGNTPTDNFVTFATQNFSTSATSSYTLTHAVSNENEIERVKCENIILPTKNVLSYDILVSMVKAHKENDYKLAFMLKYNFSMNPEEVKFIHKHSFQSNYLQEIDKVDDIHYEKTITMFQDLNELTLFFTHNTKKHTRTQKIRMYDALKKQKKHTKKYHHV